MKKNILDLVKQLREETRAGVMDCKRVLEEAKGDLKKAKQLLEKKGIAKAEKKAERETKQGYVATYTHSTGKIGVMVEFLCESDFVSRSDDFRQFTKDLCLQIAAMAPKNIKELKAQEYIREPGMTIEKLLKMTIAKFGENIKINRFERFEI